MLLFLAIVLLYGFGLPWGWYLAAGVAYAASWWWHRKQHPNFVPLGEAIDNQYADLVRRLDELKKAITDRQE